ncbi:protein MAK16 A [Carex littledalei]|uniref:Protein MAK16 homolog n=1 Tax=Carex littledalei TaxID=544730 RepID=A0A833VPR4_9POAL|nr:protein MAK16 A [Carex littledalei]
MQNDDVILDVIRHHHCSYMAKIETGKLCRNPYNVTGICNRSSCPLANSRYATIRDHDGIFYLYMKTIERAHMPNKLWERVKLPKNYMKALEIIDKHLEYWPKLLVHKIKQRLTKMTQYRIRMVKLSKKVREKIMTVPRKEKKRESRREEKALRAAQIENVIEKELLERLNKGVYPDICNYNEEIFNKLLDKNKVEQQEEEEEEEAEVEYVEGDYELEEEDELEDDIEDMADFLKSNSFEDMEADDDQLEEQPSTKKMKRAFVSYPSKVDDGTEKVKRKGKKVIVEVERDEDMDSRQHNQM